MTAAPSPGDTGAMRTPVAVGLLGVSAVGVLTLGLSMAWGDEPGEDFGDAVVATASVNSM